MLLIIEFEQPFLFDETSDTERLGVIMHYRDGGEVMQTCFAKIV